MTRRQLRNLKALAERDAGASVVRDFLTIRAVTPGAPTGGIRACADPTLAG